jgi:Rps23 Pro-64 3,4-dihydroxylase Tpa1-like proline 4-hydroxylase
MTPKQILDSFSETLMQDERILSAQERALLAAMLQHAKSSTTTSKEMREAVQAVIASAVGETVAQRAFTVLGGSIVERILGGRPFSTIPFPEVTAKAPPQPPNKTPIPPGPQPPNTPIPPGPQPPNAPLRDTPIPSGPQPPNHGIDTRVVSQANVAVLPQAAVLPAKCVILDEFLAPQELEELMRFTLEHEVDFRASEVVSPVADSGVVNYEHRRSRVLTDLVHHQDLFLTRIRNVFPSVLQELGMEEFSIVDWEVQVTASNDGDFFRFHSDNGSDRVASRQLTFVYFFHHEPPQFEGGELRIHDARLREGAYASEGSYQTIVPRQNQIVFFPCDLLHEITPVICPSGQFADSRFTLNGWLRR